MSKLQEAKQVYEFNRQSGNSIEQSITNTAHQLGVPSQTVCDWYNRDLLIDPERVDAQYNQIQRLRKAGLSPKQISDFLNKGW